MTVKVLVSSVWVVAVVLGGCGGLPFVVAEKSDVVILGVEDGGGVVVITPANDADSTETGAPPTETPPTEKGAEGGTLDAAPEADSVTDAAIDGEVVDAANEGDAEADAPCTPLLHSNGLGPGAQGRYLSCAPLGTYTVAEATLACQAYAAAAGGSCAVTTDTDTEGCTSGASSAVCSTGASPNYCWVYAGANVDALLQLPQCYVPTSWN